MRNLIAKYWFFHFLFIALCPGCNEASVKEKPNSEKEGLPPVKEALPSVKEATHYGKPFFVYDEIFHYHSELSDYEVPALLDRNNKTKSDSLEINVLFDSTPVDIADTSFIKKLAKWGFEKKSVEKFKFFALNRIFAEKEADNETISKCTTVFRDVLIFKKNKKIVGIAKICFGCGDKVIVGTDAKTVNFGYNGDYSKLEILLLN